MPRLILINGAPGSGKSTMAQRYVNAHPLALNLDVDVVRGLLGNWLDSPIEAGLRARAIALAMARVHLVAGHDVVVPQFLGRLDFIVALEQLGLDEGVEFIELALVSDSTDAQQRFVRRQNDPQHSTHRDAAALQERHGGVDALPELYERLLAVVASRPRTRTVPSIDGDPDQTFQAVLAQLE